MRWDERWHSLSAMGRQKGPAWTEGLESDWVIDHMREEREHGFLNRCSSHRGRRRLLGPLGLFNEQAT
jgi:hypothetical protein